MFYGTTRLTMDDKHQARHSCSSAQKADGHVRRRSGDDGPHPRIHVLLYPQPEFEALMARLEACLTSIKASNDFKLSFTANARDESIDRAGRLLLCADLRERAGLARSVMLVGRGNRFELWDEARWNDEAQARDEREQAAQLPPDVVSGFRL
jgi:MraZ protein